MKFKSIFVIAMLLLMSGSVYAACGTCNWYGTNYPACCNQTTGWGWESSASCIGCQDCYNALQYCTSCTACAAGTTTTTTAAGTTTTTTAAGTTTTTTAAAGGTCTWCGSGSYPQCTGSGTNCWGWENSQSCLVSGCSSGGCTAVCGGAGTTSTTTAAGTTTTTSGTSGTCPSSLSCPTSSSCGCFTVSGLGTNKKALTSAGGSQYMMASAMMETDLMNTAYSTCDGKSGDSCCCGVTKCNFYAARMANCSNSGGSTGTNYSSWCSGVNGNRSTDVSCWNAIRSYWGSNYWAVHRNGQSGPSNPNTADILGFKAVNDWTNSMISGHTTDDIRFWSNVGAI